MSDPNSNEEIDIFANTNDLITIETKELIPEYERVYQDDQIYIEDLENQFISELPIEDQNNKYYQQKIADKVRDIIELKNAGQKTFDRNNDYPFILDNYLNNDFTTEWIIPVVLDKQKIYTEIDIAGDVEEDEEEEEEVIEKPEREGIEMVNLKDELNSYDKLEKDYQYAKISYEKFIRLSTQFTRPFVLQETLDNKEVGYKTTLSHNTNLLRYYDIDNAHWQERIGTQPFYITSDVLDEKKKIKATTKKILAPGEEINIIGFFILPKNKFSLNEIVSSGISRFTKIDEIKNISKGNKTIITLDKDHGLKTGDHIVVKGNPDIDGYFKVNVVDENKIMINYDSSDDEIENVGEIYGNMRLNYKTIQINRKKGNEFEIDNKKSILKGEETLYLFDKEKISEEDFNNILKIVVPTLDDIIVRQKVELEEAKYMSEVNQILDKYLTSYNDIKIEQLNFIKEYLFKHIKTEEDETDKLRKDYDDTKKSTINKDKDFPDTIYANKHFYDKVIIDLYGNYPFRDNIFDSIENRMIWIDSHIDFGNYYYNFVLKQTDTYNKKDITESLASVSTKSKITEKTYDKEKTMDKYFKRCSSFAKEYHNKEELEEDTIEYQNGDYAILVSEKKGGVNVMLDKAMIYRWTNGKWEFQEETENNSIVYLCGLEDEKVKELKSINCIYTLEGCKSKRLYKFEKKLNLEMDAIKGYQALLEYIDNKDNITKPKLEKAKIILDAINKNNKLKEAAVEKEAEAGEKQLETLDSKIPISVVQVLGRITKVKNEYARRNLMFQLLEKDGLSIGDVVYSKKYQGYLMCGHYVYLRNEEYTNDNSIKQMVRDKLLSKYGDGGKSIPGQQSCKICGAYLSEVPYDDSPSFNDAGVPVILREEWVEESKMVMMRQVEESEKVICKSQSYRKELLSKGFTADQVETGVKICTTIQSILIKIGIKLLKSDFMNVVGDVLEKFLIVPLYPVYRKKMILSSRAKGVSADKIRKLDEVGVFKSAYLKFVTLKRYSLIMSRLLISIQTAVPPYVKTKPMTGCSFTSWDGKYGVEYLACILREMKVMMFKDKDDKPKEIQLGEIIDEIFNLLRDFKDNICIKKLYTQRFLYDRDTKPVETVKEVNKEYVPEEVPQLDKNFNKKILSNDDVKELRNQLYTRTQYLGYAIKKIIGDAVRDKDMLLPFNEQENACCREDLPGYTFGKFINEQSDNKFKDMVEESYEINPYHKLFVNKGTISKLFIDPARKIYTSNTPVHQVITERLIKDKFETYCYTGVTKGELHFFVGEGDKEKCVKCGKLLEEIKKKTFSKEEFDNLLTDIVDRKYNVPDLKEIEELVDINKLKQEDVSYQINVFVDKLAKILGKSGDEEFKVKYKSLLNALGDYPNTYHKEEEGKEEESEEGGEENEEQEFRERYETFKLLDNQLENRVKLLKIYMNQYFRKYMSIIANHYNKEIVRIPLVTSEISKQLQGYIQEQNEELGQYLTEENASLFKKLTFDYSIKDINSIYGNSDQYNCIWTEIVKSSEFNLSNATDVLLYILISQLNKFLLSDSNVVIANFIISIFDIISSDTSVFDMSRREIDKYETTIRYELYCKYTSEISLQGPNLSKESLQINNLVTDGEVDMGSLIEEQQKMDYDNAKLDMQDNEIEEFAKKQIGEGATENQIESFKERYYKNQQQNEYIYTNEFNMMQPKEDSEILEVGDDYGYMEQGTENEGDGVSLYSQAEFR